MKAIILISSIFYILGLKISSNIDLVKKSIPVNKISTNKITTKKPVQTTYFKDEVGLKTNSDSLKGGGFSDEMLVKRK